MTSEVTALEAVESPGYESLINLESAHMDKSITVTWDVTVVG